jgi:predicted enzyme related to lactoylglutathione lyase
VCLNAYPEIQIVFDRVKHAGGKIIVPKTQTNAGYIAIITDTGETKSGFMLKNKNGPSIFHPWPLSSNGGVERGEGTALSLKNL